MCFVIFLKNKTATRNKNKPAYLLEDSIPLTLVKDDEQRMNESTKKRINKNNNNFKGDKNGKRKKRLIIRSFYLC